VALFHRIKFSIESEKQNMKLENHSVKHEKIHGQSPSFLKFYLDSRGFFLFLLGFQSSRNMKDKLNKVVI